MATDPGWSRVSACATPGAGRPVRSLAGQTAELGLWLLAFAAFVTAELLAVCSKRWPRFLLLAVGSGLATILLVMLQPPLWVDATAVVAIAASLVAARGRAARAANRPG